ncbi:CWC16 protein [Syncephalastrum racemosum]|uniref:CWC16 protein n=1 Tax=Syncephalastrum racemosum TaxID=13706 RepID=A0A1X2HS55_SYNRA|nr:CWC16 protein [Syncephalastrum racemosum]
MQPFNKYFPPDWTPDKGSVNKHVGKHPLGDRARKIDQGILVVRFEMPFNVWCTGCDNHIGRGVRYNAEKKKIGNYYSTPILQFRMRCHLCSGWIEIHTDPKNSAYVVVSGARKKVEEWEPEDNEVVKLKDDETKEKLESDPLYRLEHTVQDKRTGEEGKTVLTRLQEINDAAWADPYTRSQELRRKFREQKKRDKAEHDETERLRDKHSLGIPLLPKSDQDTLAAKAVEYADLTEVEQRKLARSASGLFAKKKKTQLPPTNPVLKLGQKAVVQTRIKTDPFLSQTTKKREASSSDTLVKLSTGSSSNKKLKSQPDTKGLVAYDSDSSGDESH